MAVTYVDTLLTDRDIIRAQLNDTVSGSGPKPAGGNFSDNEIAGILAAEGSANRAIARFYEILAAAWANKGISEIGPRKEDLKAVSEHYAKLAAQWREDYGSASRGVSTGFATRVDGYSQDSEGDEV